MKRRLLWKLCFVIGAGTVVLFYVINVLTSRAEDGMSFIAAEHRALIQNWGDTAEALYLAGDIDGLDAWLTDLQTREQTWAAVVESDLQHVAGGPMNARFYEAFSLGRSVEWKIHLYFAENPIMEERFASGDAHFMVLLPERMRPGVYWGYTSIALQIVLPIILLTVLSAVLYRHIMSPLQALEKGTRAFSEGNFQVRVRELLGNRSDELVELSSTFDQMAERISELIQNQRQLIADLSHELRSPLTRMDIAIDAIKKDCGTDNIARIERESHHLRRLVEDTLTLAWLENERPALCDETLDLVDLIDVLVEDARFEFDDRQIVCHLPGSAEISQSHHRALGQAIENIIRNAMRYTPSGGQVTVSLSEEASGYSIEVCDQGPGINPEQLPHIFEPFYRADDARTSRHGDRQEHSGFGLGLALARRQVEAVGGAVSAHNNPHGGLCMIITLPRDRQL
jgi:two-component system, OmpR family, sensor histidine kinase PfeS